MPDVKPYKIKRTPGDWKKMEKSMIETSQIYKALREHHSKKHIFRTLKIGRYENIYEVFIHPKKYITLEKLFILKEMIPEMSVQEILTNISPEYKKAWYELEDHEYDQLERKLKA